MDIPLTELEKEIAQHLCDPLSLTENLFPVNENAPQTWSQFSPCIYLRPYQIAMQNFSIMVANDPELSEQENVLRQKSAGDLFSIGSRNTGKSYALKIDVVLAFIHKFREICVASFDALHLKNVTEPIASYLESHPFLQIFHLKNSTKNTVSRQPFLVKSEHGSIIKGVNEKVDSDNPGVGFHSLHSNIRFYEEFSYASDVGMQKAVDAGDSLGCIERYSGIPDLRIGSPMTKTLQDPNNKFKIWRLPQYVREDFTKETKEKQISLYGGENSHAYALNVEAKIIEGAEGFWNMARLKEQCLNPKKKIKYFEVSKNSFQYFQNRIIVERLPGAEKVFINVDLGLGGRPSEVTIIFETNRKFKYVYNISLFSLIQKEQALVLEWLYNKLGGAFIAIDAQCDGGATIDELFSLGIPQEHLLKVMFSKNIEYDFELDNNGFVQYDKNGNPLMKKMNTMDFAMSRMEHLFYGGLIEVPVDEKFFKEFNGFIVKINGTRKSYGSSTTDDLHQSMQIFAISQFYNEFNSMANQKQHKRCYGVIG